MSGPSLLTGDRVRDERNVDALLKALAGLHGRGDLDALVRSAVDGAILVTGAQRGVLLLPLPDGSLSVRTARDRAGSDLPSTLRYSGSVAKKVWTTGQPSLTMDAEGSAAGALGKSILDLRLLSILAVPLRVKDRPIGVLYVDSTATAKEFTVGDRAVFEALAGIVAVAIEQARLAAEEAEGKRLLAEMDVARKIQSSQQPSRFVAPDGFQIVAEGRPCVETSGDYYDAISLSDGSVALVVGDVSGHGLGAALFMTSARAVLRSILPVHADPLEAVRSLNAYLCRDMPQGSFMSLFVGILEPRTRRFSWVNAGHNAPLWVRPGRPPDELGPTGPVLGVVPDYAYRRSEAVVLEPGDAVFLYTDGLVEARDGSRALYGEERLQASLRAHALAYPSASGILSGVLADLATFVGTRPMDDDLTCLVLRVTGTDAPR